MIKLRNYEPFKSVQTIFLFFQAEDGIRDKNVTGVQMCALPISILLKSMEKALIIMNCSNNLLNVPCVHGVGNLIAIDA